MTGVCYYSTIIRLNQRSKLVSNIIVITLSVKMKFGEYNLLRVLNHFVPKHIFLSSKSIQAQRFVTFQKVEQTIFHFHLK